jgi:hypothetical protein
MTGYVGADPRELDELALMLEQAADRLRRVNAEVTRRVQRSSWCGQHRDVFVQDWLGVGRRRVAAAGARLDEGARQVRRNAAQQRDASAGYGGAIGAAGSLSERRLPAADVGANVVAQALSTVDDDGVKRNQFSVIRLSDGRYIVVLAGVTNLSDAKGALLAGATRGALVGGLTGSGLIGGALAGGIADVAREWSRKGDTPRMMSSAIPAYVTRAGTDPYAEAVKRALRRQGVPDGAEVMLVGHSHGSYAALELASDPSFNRAMGTGSGSYGVKVTHVFAAAASADYLIDRVPPQTSVLSFNNRNDWVAGAEAVDDGRDTVRPVNHVELSFDGGRTGFGHEERNYIEWLRSTSDSRAQDIFRSAGERYSAPQIMQDDVDL